MKSLVIENGNLLTEVKLTYQGKSTELNKMLVDTSSRHTVLAREEALKLGLMEKDAAITYNTFNLSISVGPLKINDFTIEVKDMEKAHLDGILGMDFLKRVGAKINLESMTLSGSRVN